MGWYFWLHHHYCGSLGNHLECHSWLQHSYNWLFITSHIPRISTCIKPKYDTTHTTGIANSNFSYIVDYLRVPNFYSNKKISVIKTSQILTALTQITRKYSEKTSVLKATSQYLRLLGQRNRLALAFLLQSIKIIHDIIRSSLLANANHTVAQNRPLNQRTYNLLHIG